MTEKQAIEEFEKEWNKQPKPMGSVPGVLMNALKEMAKQFWIAAWRMFDEKAEA